MSRRPPSARRTPQPTPLPPQLQHLNLNAAAIDIGSTSHFVAVPEGRDSVNVREFATFTADLHRLADWLEQCGVDTVVMESTAVYWIPVFELLEQRGFKVLLVNARHVKNVTGRQSDVLDCHWLHQLHTYGLLNGAFRPDEQIVVLRSSVRHRAMLVQSASAHTQHRQKALQQMNGLLHLVVADITGVTGMAIIRAILDGERDPLALASLRDYRCKHSAEVIAKSLEGNYRQEHLFALQQAVTLYETYRAQIAACDRQLEQYLATCTPVTRDPPPTPAKPRQRSGNPFDFDAHTQLYRLTGVDLTRIDGIDAATALTVISEVGTDMTRWQTVKHFTSWLGLCPGTKKSGGRVLSSKTKPSANRAAAALRIAATSLYRSHSALGAYLRRMSAKLGKPQAVTATAHKLARLVYSMLKHGTEYVDAGQDYYERHYRERVVQNLTRRAKELGLVLVPETPAEAVT
jgi:transposase